MNKQITRIAGLAMGLLIALIVATTYWQTWARPALAERQDNAIQRVAQFEIKRGPKNVQCIVRLNDNKE